MRRPLREKQKHKPAPDHVYNSERVSKFINFVMERGKKSAAERIVYDALDLIKEKTKSDPLAVFETAIVNVGPTMEVRSKRVGGANYQIPYEVRPERRQALAFRWIIGAAASKKGASIREKLADELIAASKEEGEAMKKRETTHRMAEANKAFAHFAWTGSRKKVAR